MYNNNGCAVTVLSFVGTVLIGALVCGWPGCPGSPVADKPSPIVNSPMSSPTYNPPPPSYNTPSPSPQPYIPSSPSYKDPHDMSSDEVADLLGKIFYEREQEKKKGKR